MAIGERRYVFVDDVCWCLQVRAEGGSGSWTEDAMPTDETVYASPCGDTETQIRFDIEAGKLRLYSHEAVLQLIHQAERLSEPVYKLWPYKREKPQHRNCFTDSEGLEWAFKSVPVFFSEKDQAFIVSGAYNVFCLDDDAIHGIFRYVGGLENAPLELKRNVADFIKSGFLPAPAKQEKL